MTLNRVDNNINWITSPPPAGANSGPLLCFISSRRCYQPPHVGPTTIGIAHVIWLNWCWDKRRWLAIVCWVCWHKPIGWRHGCLCWPDTGPLSACSGPQNTCQNQLTHNNWSLISTPQWHEQVCCSENFPSLHKTWGGIDWPAGKRWWGDKGGSY